MGTFGTQQELNCIDCSCRELSLGDNICDDLREMNDSRVKGASLVLKDTKLCDYTKVFPKALFSIWCMFKNIIKAICWILGRLKNVENKINEIIDEIAKICRALKCLIDYVKEQAEKELEIALQNISFNMETRSSSDDTSTTFMESSSDNEGNYTFKYNLNDGVSTFAYGYITGKVNHSYTPNDDGSIQANISSITLSNVRLDVHGQNTAVDKNISLRILSTNGQTLFYKQYDGTQSWNENVNKTVSLNLSQRLEPSQSGETIKVLDIHDNWIYDTHGSAFARYDNNNQTRTKKVPDCDIICGTLDKLTI